MIIIRQSKIKFVVLLYNIHLCQKFQIKYMFNEYVNLLYQFFMINDVTKRKLKLNLGSEILGLGAFQLCLLFYIFRELKNY